MNGDDLDPEDTAGDRGVLHGFLIGVAIHMIGAAVMFIQPEALMLIGVVQLVYMIPALIVLVLMGASKRIQKGFVLSGIIVFLLNAACFGVVLVALAFTGPWGG